MREIDDIEGLFKESFEGFEVTPPASVKTGIDGRLKQRTGAIWWLSAFLIVLAAAATVSAYLFFPSGQKDTISMNQPSSANHTHNQFNSGDQENNTKNKGKALSASFKTDSNKQKTIEKKITSVTKKKTSKTISENKTSRTAAGSKQSSKSKLKSLTAQTQTKKTVSNTRTKIKKDKKAVVSLSNSKSGNQSSGQKGSVFNSTSGNSSSSVNNQSSAAMGGNTNQTSGSEDSSHEGDNSLGEHNVLNAIDTNTTNNKTVVQDSTSTANISADSTSTEKSGADKDDKHKDPRWLISAYFGPQYNFQRSVTQDEKLDFSPSFRTSLEANYSLPMNFGVSTGFGYNKSKESFNFTYTVGVDTVGQSLDSTPIFDQQNPDSIIGYNVFVNYQIDTIKGTRSNSFTTTVMFIPIHLSRTFEITDQWIVMADIGATLSFYKTVKDDSSNPLTPEPVTNNFGINASMRLHAGYKMDNWLFTLGVNGSIYFKTPVDYEGLNNTNKRYFISPQLGVHYVF